jgi:hypothetical protein
MKVLEFKRWRATVNEHFLRVEVEDDFDPETVVGDEADIEPWDLKILDEWENELDCTDSGSWKLDE